MIDLEPGASTVRLTCMARLALGLVALLSLAACGSSPAATSTVETQGLRCPSTMTEHAIFDYSGDAIGAPSLEEALETWRAQAPTEFRPEWSSLTPGQPEGRAITFSNDRGEPQLRVEFTDFLGTGWLVEEYTACAEVS
jgi:hypothetical protein